MSTAETRHCYRHPDRETGLSCSECGRPICADCATFAPVGIRCPDHAGVRRSPTTRLKPRPVRRARGVALASGNALVTRILIAINIVVYALQARSSNIVRHARAFAVTTIFVSVALGRTARAASRAIFRRCTRSATQP